MSLGRRRNHGGTLGIASTGAPTLIQVKVIALANCYKGSSGLRRVLGDSEPPA
jgi:hypothetical protein